MHLYDIPGSVSFSLSVAIDTEAMGLYPTRDRLCLVQLCDRDGAVHLVQFPKPIFSKSPNLVLLLKNASVLKIFHYGRFDLALLMHTFGIDILGVYCTKIASRLVRTYTDRHSLKDLCKEILKIELKKEEQSSDWGREILTEDQCLYAMRDVIHLHDLKKNLDAVLVREDRLALAQACFEFLPHRARMDLMVSEDFDVFRYK